jgi:hypothetical protein
VIRPAKPVFEFIGRDNAAIGEAIDFEHGRPSVCQIGNYSNFCILKAERSLYDLVERRSCRLHS